jgi:hypothetical protein
MVKSRWRNIMRPGATGRLSLWFVLIGILSSGGLLQNGVRSSGARAAQEGTPKLTPNAAAARSNAVDGEQAEAEAEPSPGRVPPLVIQRPGELGETSMSGTYRFYLGTTHAHSGYSGDHAKTIAEKFNKGVADYNQHTPREIYARAKANGFDFYFLTDHSSPEQNEFYKNGFTDAHWAATQAEAERATTADFVALRGYEFSRNVDPGPERGGLGHMNVLNSPDWFSAYAKGHTFAWLYDELASRGRDRGLVVCQFNHPEMPGPKGKNFNDYQGRTRERNEVVRLVEIWNSTEKMNYVPVVQKIWALGWKVAPAAGTDVHGLFGIENRRIRTGVLAERLTADAIMQALKARRVYATLEPKLHLEFTLNGFEMGSTLTARPAGELQARVFVNDPAGTIPVQVEIHGGRYATNGGATQMVASLPVPKNQHIVAGPVPGGYDFYYAVVFKQGIDTARAFTAPIWMDDN